MGLSDGEIAGFCAAWKEGEDSLKHVEAELIRLPLQPINELRYATRHFARACETLDEQERLTEYQAAMRHCTYAAYDCAEAVLTYRLLRFKDFVEEFKTMPIETPVLNYKDAVLAYRKAQGAICRNPDQRDQRKKEIIEACESLEPFDACLDVARDELNKKRELARREAQEAREVRRDDNTTSAFRWKVSTIIALLGLAVACAKIWGADSQAHPDASGDIQSLEPGH